MENVIELCGEYPLGFEKKVIASDPNFVFEPENGYEPRELFNPEGYAVTVSSFVECEHYVSGGWDSSPLNNKEAELVGNLLFIVVVVVLLQKFIKLFSK